VCITPVRVFSDDLLQLPDDIYKRRPNRLLAANALEGELSHTYRDWNGPLRPRIEHGFDARQLTVNVGKLILDTTAVVLQSRRSPREKLEEDHTEGINLGSLRDHSCANIQRIGISNSSRSVLNG
jgi:hypothetical protein